PLLLVFFCLCSLRLPPSSTLFPYTTLFRSLRAHHHWLCLVIGALAGIAKFTKPGGRRGRGHLRCLGCGRRCCGDSPGQTGGPSPDRKSTRLNSSHVKISYAVFCLKKKNKQE